MSGPHPDGHTTGPLERPTEPMPTAGEETLAGGRYELGELLGAGGMGLVRRATDTVLHRDVAVKLLADNLAADPEARERFLREARAAARVTDPHVVTVHDVGEEGSRPYLVMELVDGPSLAAVLSRTGPLDAHEVVGVAAQALAGIAAAHGAGLLHRDVKPGNLLQAPDGSIKVADFGVAEAADVPGLTRTGFVIGTRSYLAPERRRGAPASVATDLYALGATLTELLTGSPPADESAPLPPEVPASLERLLARLLASRPEDRPESAEAALYALAEGRSSTASEAAGAVDEQATIHVAVPTERLPAEPDPAAETTSAAETVRSAVTAPDERPRAGRRFLDRGWRVVLLVGIALLAIGLLLRLGADEDPATNPADAGDAEFESGPDDAPADVARELARWLRERAED